MTPIFSVPAHVACDCGPLQAWFTQPRGAVVQLMEAGPLTAAMAKWMVGPGFDGLIARFADAADLLLVLDVRAMTDREPSVRPLLMEQGRQHLWRFSTTVLIPPLKASPIYLSALHAALALLSAFAAPIQLESSVDEVLARYKLSPL